MSTRLPPLRLAVGGLAGLTLAARVIALLREVLIARSFGVSPGLDAAYLGLSLPIALTVGVGGGLARAAVPVGAALSSGRLAGFARGALARLALVLMPVSIALAATSPLWTRLLAQELDGTLRTTLIWGAILGALTLFGGAVAGLLVGVVNARGRHVEASLNPLLYNFVWTLAVVLFARSLGPLSVAVGVLLAEWLQIPLQWHVLRRITAGAAPERSPDDTRRLWALLWPAAVLGFATGLNLTVDRVFAQALGQGAVSALAYADKVVNLPVGLLGMTLAVPLFTRLSRYRAASDPAAAERAVVLGLRLLLVASVPIAVLVGVEGPAVVTVLFRRGAFGPEAVEFSATALAGFAWGLPYLAMVPLLANAALATDRPWRPVVAMGALVVANAALDWVLARAAGLIGIAVSTSIIAALRVGVLLALVAPGVLRDRGWWGTHARAGIAAAVQILALLGAAQLLPAPTGLVDSIIRLGIAGIASATVVLLMWPVVVGAEWRSLSELRRRVAHDAASLDTSSAGASTP